MISDCEASLEQAILGGAGRDAFGRIIGISIVLRAKGVEELLAVSHPVKTAMLRQQWQFPRLDSRSRRQLHRIVHRPGVTA